MCRLLLLLAALPVTVLSGQHAPRIIGGTTVEIRDAPWQASVVILDAPLCSGAIVEENFVLTSGWCVHGVPTSALKVRVGTSSRSTGGSLIAVCGVRIHPHYHLRRYDNDLALLHLCENVTLADNGVQAIPLAAEAPRDNVAGIVSGWGHTWSTSLGFLLNKFLSHINRVLQYWIYCGTRGSQQLQQANVRIHNWRQCAADLPIVGTFNPIQGLSERTLCTVGAGGRAAGACFFDEGAPLVVDGLLVGILGTAGCARKPDVYANLALHKSWLKANTK